MKTYYFIFLTILLSACYSQGNKTLKEILPAPDTLRFTPMQKGDLFIGKPIDMVVLDDYIVLQDGVEGYWFALLDRSSGKLIRRFGAIGRGPEELIHPFALKGIGNCITFTELAKKKFYTYSMDSIAAESLYFIVKEINIKLKAKDYADCRYPYLLSSGEIIASAVHPNGRIILLDTLGEEKGCFSPQYPFDPLHKEENYKIKSQAFQYDIGVNEDETMICHIALSTEHFELFRREADSIKKVVEYVFSLPKYQDFSKLNVLQIAFEKESRPGFSNLRCVKDKIWFTIESEDKQGRSTFIGDILCFDWQGQALACYKPNMILKLLSVAPDGKRIYALALDKETSEPLLVFTNIE